jgi:RNA ligase (TIGR02306 family)
MEEFHRKLASIRKVSEVRPIVGADNIELAIIDGWQCIIKKGEFAAGDLCVYFEIDSFLPIRPEFEFLRKSSYKKMGDKEGFRLRTIRLRGELSQGLALPPSILISENRMSFCTETFNGEILNNDVTDRLKVVKYESPQEPVRGSAITRKPKANFPTFVRKTDLERVQNIWNKVKDCEETFEVSIKLDGASCTFYLYNGKFGVCSRNYELEDEHSFANRAKSFLSQGLKIAKAVVTFRWSRIPAIRSRLSINGPNNIYWQMAKKYKIEDILRSYGKNIAMQGEIVGESIQCNPEKIKGQEFHLFDVWDIDKHCYYSIKEKNDFYVSRCRFMRDGVISSFPYLGAIDKKKVTDFKSINDILAYADGPSVHAATREGLAFKSYSSNLRFKVISNQYLLKQGQYEA